MQLTIARENLLILLQQTAGVVERRQTLPILSHVLVKIAQGQLSMAATDLEVALVSPLTEETFSEDGAFTLPARKAMDICRALPDGAMLTLNVDGNKITLTSGRSRFNLLGLGPEEFPTLGEGPGELEFSLPQKVLGFLLSRTAFAMAQQDVRYYLNGMLWELSSNGLRVVATDGHRLAYVECPLKLEGVENTHPVIIPRKAVMELQRLLGESEDPVMVTLSQNHVRLATADFSLTTKLIDGRFPDYRTVIPRQSQQALLLDRDIFRQLLARVAVLSNEKYHGIQFRVRPKELHIATRNSELEEAEDSLEVDYDGTEMEIGFNVHYLLDVLNTLPAGQVQVNLTDADSSVLIQREGEANCLYVVMPMRL